MACRCRRRTFTSSTTANRSAGSTRRRASACTAPATGSKTHCGSAGTHRTFRGRCREPSGRSIKARGRTDVLPRGTPTSPAHRWQQNASSGDGRNESGLSAAKPRLLRPVWRGRLQALSGVPVLADRREHVGHRGAIRAGCSAVLDVTRDDVRVAGVKLEHLIADAHRYRSADDEAELLVLVFVLR